MSALNDYSSSAYILLKPCKGRIALRKGKFEQVEVEPGCIFELDNSEHFAVGSRKMNFTLKSLDVRGLLVECPSYYVDVIAKRHACLLLACSDFQERLKLYSDSEQLEKLLHAKAGERVKVAMNDGTYMAAIVHSVKPIKLDSPAVYFEVEPEGSLNGTAFSCNRFFVSFDRVSVPERLMHIPPALLEMAQPAQSHRESNSVRSADLQLEFAELSPTKGFGNLDSGHVAQYTPYLCSNDLEVLVGKPKGIQGHSNSCYMDAALFSMFSCCNAFDSYLLHCRKDVDVKRKHVVDVLRCDIVYPLRKYQYVRADRVMEFRRLITEIAPDMKGFMEEEKDVEEFLNLLFGRICQVEPDIKLSSNESSYLFQLICSDQQSSSQSCKTVIPTRFILQIPRYGKERLYRGVLPSLQLDISSILLCHPHVCWKCSSLADLQCLECYLTETHWLKETFFCFTCFREFHSALKSEQDHAVVTLPSINVRSPPSPVILQLAAVLCIESSHYVSFVRVGDRPESDWIFFDSMADREGEESGHNVPEVRLCPDISRWLSAESVDQLHRSTIDSNVSAQFERLITDCYLCFYYWPDARGFMRSSCLMSVSTSALSSLFDSAPSKRVEYFSKTADARPTTSSLACPSKARYRQTNLCAFSRNLSYATSTSYAALLDVPIFQKNFFITRSCCEESQYFSKELNIEQTCSSCSSIEKYLRMLRLGGCMNNGKIVPRPPTSTRVFKLKRFSSHWP
ncbi:Ubiquitin carboxyl-terminal hydrolase CYLD [Trichinella pseudospiralis]|uniref:Ubiquitin carboxyl-terminal hydrolase CYLD n=1 Tax=Trichinella pseudospiralis TaxID=6337 RepID=A0A0V1FJI8_TRIPS|nr:Ubiquitin carboxyl-terminal hydrolase CYLD [Trichinella pseudospiralis]